MILSQTTKGPKTGKNSAKRGDGGNHAAPARNADADLIAAIPEEALCVSLSEDDVEILGDLNELRFVDQSTDPLATDTFVGMTLADRYEIGKLIGSGGMGRVYQAYQRTMNRTVAIKVLKSDMAAEPTLVERFRQEARALSRLSHPNTITVHDFGQASEQVLYIVMEYLNGKPLSRLLKQSPPPDRVLDIMIQVCDSLSEAHELGIVHRDLKPANIFLCRIGSKADHVKVLDFGIAKIGAANTGITQGNQIIGTPKYMSPELIAGQEVDCRADIYSLGVLMYELLSGRPLFVVESPLDYFTKHLDEVPLPLTDVDSPYPIPPALSDVVATMLVKEPARRIQKISDVVPLLVGILQQYYGAASIRRVTDSRAFFDAAPSGAVDGRRGSGTVRVETSPGGGADEVSMLEKLARLYESKQESGHAARVYAQIGSRYVHLGDDQAAALFFHRAIAAGDRRSGVKSALAQCCQRLGKDKEAILLYKELLRTFELEGDRESVIATLSRLASAYSSVNDQLKADIALRRAKSLAAAGASERERRNAGRPTTTTEKVAKRDATRQHGRAERLLPTTASIEFHLRAAHEMLGKADFGGALSSVRNALLQAPTNRQALSVAARILEEGRRALKEDERMWLKIITNRHSAKAPRPTPSEEVSGPSARDALRSALRKHDMVPVESCRIESVLGKTAYRAPRFAISRTPITNAQYYEFVNATGEIPPGDWFGFRPPKERISHPVVGITLSQAMAYATWRGVRLPTVLEWECAARGPEGWVFPWGNTWDAAMCHCRENGARGTASVTLYAHSASPFGCVDMIGNVWEWTTPDPRAHAPDVDYTWVRGGSFKHPCMRDGHIAWTSVLTESTYGYLGFRCALDVEARSDG